MGEADEDVGTETHRKADEVGDAVVVANIFNLPKITILIPVFFMDEF
jgi:hypothetical protein